MYEFYGWAALNYHTHDTNELLKKETIVRFIEFIQSKEIKDIYMIKSRNGLDSFMISALHNHKHEYVFEIFSWIADNLPGSYGLLYIQDDESKDSFNKFIVYKLARGMLTKEEDYYLSPCIPIIEDEYNPSRDD